MGGEGHPDREDGSSDVHVRGPTRKLREEWGAGRGGGLKPPSASAGSPASRSGVPPPSLEHQLGLWMEVASRYLGSSLGEKGSHACLTHGLRSGSSGSAEPGEGLSRRGRLTTCCRDPQDMASRQLEGVPGAGAQVLPTFCSS